MIKRNFLYCILALCLIILTNNELRAQGVSMSAPQAVTVNKPFNLTINSEVQGEVVFPEVNGMEIISGPSTMVSYSSNNINGRITTTSQISHTYILVFTKEGAYEIPPVTIKDGKKELKGNKLNIQVFPAGISNQSQGGDGSAQEEKNTTVLLQQIPSTREVYLGEQLVFSTKILVRERLQITNLSSPSLDGFWNQEIEADQIASRDYVNGMEYATQVIKRSLLVPQKAGEIVIQPAVMDVVIQKRVQRQRPRSPFGDIFDDPFFDSPFDSYQNVQERISSNPVRITVKPLPQGAPASFRSAVGKFTIKSVLSRDSLAVNESLSLKVTLSGSGNLALIEAPKLDFPSDLEVFEPKTSTDLKHGITGTTGNVVFEYILIPRRPGQFRIAPFEFSWLNPETGRYQQFSSGEFRFSVSGETSGGEQSLIQGPASLSKAVKDLGTDILFIKINPGKFEKKGKYFIKSSWLMTFPAVLLLLLLLFVIVRKTESELADPYIVRNKKAAKTARKRMKNAGKLLAANDEGFYDEVIKSYMGYFSDKLGIPTLGLSRDNLNQQFRNRNIPGDLISGIWEVVDECEMSRYARTSGADPKLLYVKALENLTRVAEIL